MRLKGSDKDWLLIKKADAWADADAARPFSQVSVLSGLTLEELRDGHEKAQSLRRAAEAAGAPREPVDPKVRPRHARRHGRRPVHRSPLGLRDQVRRLPAARRARRRRGARSCATAAASTRPRSSPSSPSPCGISRTATSSSTARSWCSTTRAAPSFQRLQKRTQLRRRTDIERATVELPATLYVFDLLAFEGFDLRPLPLEERKRLLRMIVPEAGPLRYCDHVPEQGEAMFAQVERMGLEGMIAKRRDSPYSSRRSSDWLKLPADRVGHFVIVGYTAPKRGRVGLGALHLAVHTPRASPTPAASAPASRTTCSPSSASASTPSRAPSPPAWAR